MNTREIEQAITPLISLLVARDYGGAVAACRRSRLSPEDIALAIRDYGHALSTPPPESYASFDAVPLAHALSPTWSVVVPLWTVVEGRSDLSLELTLGVSDGRWWVDLDDLRVL